MIAKTLHDLGTCIALARNKNWLVSGCIHRFGVAFAAAFSGEISNDPVGGDVSDFAGAAFDQVVRCAFGSSIKIPGDGIAVWNLLKSEDRDRDVVVAFDLAELLDGFAGIDADDAIDGIEGWWFAAFEESVVALEAVDH